MPPARACIPLVGGAFRHRTESGIFDRPGIMECRRCRFYRGWNIGRFIIRIEQLKNHWIQTKRILPFTLLNFLKGILYNWLKPNSHPSTWGLSAPNDSTWAVQPWAPCQGALDRFFQNLAGGRQALFHYPIIPFGAKPLSSLILLDNAHL